MNNQLEIEALSVAYRGKLPVLRGINLSLEIGVRAALIGESGCGKTTLARAVMGLLQPQSGTIRFRDHSGNVFANPTRKERAHLVQMIFQDPYQSLNPRQTVKRTLEEAIRAAQVLNGEDVDKSCLELLDSVGLDESALPKYPHEFSGGQRQRISIARALAPNPLILVCDEAVSALDVTTQKKVVQLLVHLSEVKKLTLFFISHDLPLVQEFCQKLMVMEGGRIVESGRTESILLDPQSTKTKELMDSVIAL